MALIIETGSGDNLDANSYQSVEDLRIYAKIRGISLNHLTDAECETLLIKAMDYLEAKGPKYKGHKTSASQPLQWPRSDVWDVELPGARHPSDDIPRLLQYAQLSLALEAINQDLQPNRPVSDKGQILKEKVGDIEIVYSESTPTQAFTDAFAKPQAMLSALLKNNGLRLIRS